MNGFDGAAVSTVGATEGSSVGKPLGCSVGWSVGSVGGCEGMREGNPVGSNDGWPVPLVSTGTHVYCTAFDGIMVGVMVGCCVAGTGMSVTLTFCVGSSVG